MFSRMHWLLLGRVAIITFLLGIAVFSDLEEMELIPQRSLSLYYMIIVTTYVLSFCYLFLPAIIKSIKLNVYIQSFCDVALVTSMVYVTGGTSSIYSVFYTLIIIYSVLFLERSGSFIIASACSITYGTLLDMEYYKVIQPLYSVPGDNSSLAGYVFARIFTHILSFYIIAFLASFVVGKEKKLRLLLAAREDAFEQLDMLHRSIVKSVSLGILTINQAGRIKSFNPAAEAITGYRFPEVEDKQLTEILPISIYLLGKGENLPVENRFEMAFQTRENRQVILGCSISSLKDSKSEKIGDVIIFQDLTSIKNMEENYEKGRRMALIGEMAARLAHEIRNPLATISGSLQVLSGGLKLRESDERLLRIVMRGKEQLESFLKDFLLLARPMPGQPALVNTCDMIEDVLEALRYTPDWHEGISIELELAKDAWVYANKEDIRHIIWNLFLNALQAMPHQGALQIETRRSDNGTLPACLEISVADTGCGIEAANLTNIFEPFYTTKEHGTGLGLAIVSRVVAHNQGKVEIVSEVGKGTKCTVRLPLAKNGDVEQPVIGNGR